MRRSVLFAAAYVGASDAKVFNRKERKEKHAEVAKENLSGNLVLLHFIIHA